MRRKRLRWKRAAVALTAALAAQNGFLVFGGQALAQEETEQADLRELTAPQLQTEEGAASYARLRIGDWLDYGDYEIERTDIPGTDYFFYITTQAADETVIDDDQLAYCVQSYFLTPLPGDHTEDMTDQVSSIGGGKNLQKVIYYGYGGAGYEADEFVEFLAQADAGYCETVYSELSESEQAELCYVLTHGAASYAYFLDGTSLEEYMKLQFQLKYGESWEGELERFEAQELEKAGITDDDMDLFGATYGMNPTGIALTKGWYELLTSKEAPDLDITVEDGTYTFHGNERNSDLELTFTVPEGFFCTVYSDGRKAERITEGEKASVHPAESFAFTFSDEAVSTEKGGVSQLSREVEGTLSGTEKEAWNLVLLQTNKGTKETISKRQQDIAAVSMVDGGRTDLDFEIELRKGSVSIHLTDDEGQAVQGAEFGVYYDEECDRPVRRDGEAVQVTTDSQGEAYLEFAINQDLEENDGRLYLRELAAPTGYLGDQQVQCIEVDGNAELTNEQETISVNGAVSWRVPEGTALPEEISAVLKQDDKVLDTKTLTEEDDWSYEWSGLPKYHRGEDGSASEYDYRVEITPIEGYDTEIKGYDVVNTITGETSLEGQGVWHDHDDADGLRPESLVVNLYRNGEQIDSAEISDTNDWRYSFEGLDQYSEDGSEEYAYTLDAEAPEGYTLDMEGDQIVGIHTASTALDIEGLVDLTGRNLKEGEFSFELTQVTDETGESEAANGTHGTAVNDSDGRVVFPDITCTEPGTYYYRITETPAADAEDGSEASSYIVKAEVTIGGEDMDQLEAVITYPNGQPEFKHEYTASGEAVIDDIQVVLENGTLAEGMFQVELRDQGGKVLQTGTNDGAGKVILEPLKYTEEDIGREYVYTVSEVDSGEDNITYDSAVHEVTVKIEDSSNSDGTLEITQEKEGILFTNIIVEPETETETEAVTETETETETEAAAETETETETEVAAETETEAVTEMKTETEDQTGISDTEAGAKAVSSSKTESDSAENAKTGSHTAIWIVLLVILVAALLIFRWSRRKK